MYICPLLKHMNITKLKSLFIVSLFLMLPSYCVLGSDNYDERASRKGLMNRLGAAIEEGDIESVKSKVNTYGLWIVDGKTILDDKISMDDPLVFSFPPK